MVLLVVFHGFSPRRKPSHWGIPCREGFIQSKAPAAAWHAPQLAPDSLPSGANRCHWATGVSFWIRTYFIIAQPQIMCVYIYIYMNIIYIYIYIYIFTIGHPNIVLWCFMVFYNSNPHMRSCDGCCTHPRPAATAAAPFAGFAHLPRAWRRGSIHWDGIIICGGYTSLSLFLCVGVFTSIKSQCIIILPYSA